MQVVIGILTGVLGLVVTAAMLGLLAAVARRVMAAPVGWIRSGVVALLATSTSSAVLSQVLDDARRTAADGGGDLGTWAVLFAFALAFAGAFVLGLCALLVLELLVPTGSIPGPVRAFRALRQGRRETRRYAQVVAIGVRHGLGGTFGRGGRGADGGRLARYDAHRVAVGIRETLSDAGVTFVKFGQLLSTRRDLLPDVVVEELSKLQSDVPPVPWTQIEPAVVRALGRPLDEVFARFDTTPIASGSVGQAHGAALLDGREVVVKVQRPGARDQVEVDLAILAQLARRLERDTAWGRGLGVVAIAEGFATSLREELDYTVEAENTLALRAAVATAELTPSGHRIVVPDVHLAASSRTMLVQERLTGVPVVHAEVALAAAGPGARRELADLLLGATLEQLLVAGTFHADLHPGNVMVTASGGLGLLDLGSVGRLGEPERVALGAFLMAIDADDAIAATDALLELLGAPGGIDTRSLERAVGQLLLRLGAGAGPDAAFAGLFTVVAAAGISVPPQVAFAFRTFTALDGTLQLLCPGYDLVAGARAAGRPLLSRLLTFSTLRRKVTGQLAGMAPELQRLPRRVTRIVSDLEEGRFVVSVRAFADPQDRAFLTGLVQQVVSTIVATAATLSAVVLLAADGGPMFAAGIPLYTVLGAGLAFVGLVLGVRVLVFAFRGDPSR